MPKTDLFAVTSDPRGPMGFAHGEVLNAFLAREPRKSVRSPAGSDATDNSVPRLQVSPGQSEHGAKRSDTNADSFF